MFTYIFHILEFPGIISFPKNSPETIRISQNSGNFLQSGNTANHNIYAKPNPSLNPNPNPEWNQKYKNKWIP